jgi:hypothetical protein
MKTITDHELFHVKKAFHHHSNVHFFRNEDGSVTIMSLIGETKDGTSSHGWRVYEIGFEHTMGADSWASIVSSVSKKGGSAESYDQAKKLHNDETPNQ